MVSNTASMRLRIIFNFFVPKSCISVLETAQGSWVIKGACVTKQNQEACYSSFLHLLPVSKRAFIHLWCSVVMAIYTILRSCYMLRKATYLRKQRSFFPNFLQTICYEPLHCFGAVLVQLAEVWRSISSANHENNLKKEQPVGSRELKPKKLLCSFKALMSQSH